jgi:hypothetical protein
MFSAMFISSSSGKVLEKYCPWGLSPKAKLLAQISELAFDLAKLVVRGMKAILQVQDGVGVFEEFLEEDRSLTVDRGHVCGLGAQQKLVHLYEQGGIVGAGCLKGMPALIEVAELMHQLLAPGGISVHRDSLF